MNLSQFFGQGFDPQSVEPQNSFPVLPPGKYPVQIEAAEFKPTKKGDGHLIELQMVVLDGPGKGQKLWDRINIDNPSQQCVEIGLSCLSALCRATDISIFTDESQLLGRMCVACVKVDGSYNSIRTYESLSPPSFGPAAQQPPRVQAPAPQAPPMVLPLNPQPPSQPAPQAAPVQALVQQPPTVATPPQSAPVGQQVLPVPAQQVAKTAMNAGEQPPWANPSD